MTDPFSSTPFSNFPTHVPYILLSTLFFFAIDHLSVPFARIFFPKTIARIEQVDAVKNKERNAKGKKGFESGLREWRSRSVGMYCDICDKSCVPTLIKIVIPMDHKTFIIEQGLSMQL